MKKRIQQIKKLIAIVLPLVFLSSCYEIVYVSQDADRVPGDILRPDLCIQVYNVNDKPITPYIGFLVHQAWDVKNGFVYTKVSNGSSVVVGKFLYNYHLSSKMEMIDPAPNGYIWWVGAGDALIEANGVYHAYPLMHVGNHSGTFAVDYMFGDSENGLNVHRSNKHALTVVNIKSPSSLKASNKGKTVMLKWKEPKYNANLAGYNVIRDGVTVNEHPVTNTMFVDQDLNPGVHSYTILPVYANGAFGKSSIPANICYSPCGTSMDFDGIDDKLIVFDDPSLRMKKALTMEAWIKPGPSEMQDPRIISKGGDGVGYELLLTQFGSLYSLEFRLPFAYLKSIQTIQPERWYHVAAVYDGKSMRLYINGKPDCNRMASGYVANTSYPLIIGKSSMDNANYFNGDIDDARIWNVARTPAQIYDNFSSGVSPNEKGLVGSWGMSEGCSVVTCDLSKEGNDAFLSGSCFCGEVYPFVENTTNLTNTGLVVPVMNYTNTMKGPKTILLEFKINPKLVQFEGIITENTQLENYAIKTMVTPDGTIRIKAGNFFNAPLTHDVLVFIDLKPLIPQLNTQLKFNRCEADGVNLRVASGGVVATALPGGYVTTGVNDRLSDPVLSIYPNPATTFLTLEVSELSSAAEIRVVSITGQEVYRYSLEPNQSNTVHKIDLLGFSKGIYLITLQQNDEVHVKKFAVN